MELFQNINKALRQYLVYRGVRSVQQTVDGRAVHFYDVQGTGRGPPLLLVHGLGGSANGFYKVMLPLAERFSRVLAVDVPGNGFSPMPESGPLKLEESVSLLERFIRDVIKEPCVLLGTSLGGAMAIATASKASDLIRALLLVAPAGARVSEDRLTALFKSFAAESYAEAWSLVKRLFHKPPLGSVLFVPTLKKMYATDAVKSVLAQAKTTDAIAPEILGGLSMPLLLIWGESEKLLPYEGIDYFRAHLPSHAQIEVVRGFGHVPHVERPVELVKRLCRFADDAHL